MRTGEADEKWMDISEVLKDMLDQEASEELAVEMLVLAKELYAECERVQMNLAKPAKN